MACDPCFCFSLKDSAVMVGIWTSVYSIASMFLFGWQTGVLNHCRTVTMSQANLQCEWDCPCVGASNARTTRIIEGLFVIQILCLIAAFFLLFASVTLIYGVHTWSRHLIWPWFICVVSSILSSLAYCIMWWAGDVRDYWMVITIVEIITVFINIYCVLIIYMFMKRLSATTDEYEGKHPQVRYKINRNGYNRKNFDGYHDNEIHQRTSQQIMNSTYPNYITPLREPRPPRRPTRTPQTYSPTPPQRYPTVPPYPVDDIEPIQYEQEPKTRYVEKDDSVTQWVKDQQRIAQHSEKGEAVSEPVSPSRHIGQQVPLQHSHSVPSLYNGSLVSHKNCRHGKHRSSTRHRSRSRHALNTTSSESPIEYSHDRRRRHSSRSRTRWSESDVTESTDRLERGGSNKRRRSHRSHHGDERDDRRIRKEKDEEKHRRDRNIHDRDRRHSRHKGTNEKGTRHREGRDMQRNTDIGRITERSEKDVSLESAPADGVFPLSGGISIPQHIIIPPSVGERGPDGNPLPQKFQINSEITINYDGHRHTSPSSDIHESYRRYPAVGMQSNV